MPRSLLRRTGADDQFGSTPLELFYDLVFVFAVTQVSHLLINHLTWEGAGQAAVVLLVVWWAWNYTTWVMNELDPESSLVQLMLIGLMLASMLMAIAIPQAFGERAALFATSYVVVQVGRHTFLTFVAAPPGSHERHRAVPILIWFCASGVLWIAGGIATGPARTVLWLAALTIDYTAPLFIYWVPGRWRVRSEDWQVSTAHFTERFGLFVIIALGESIVVTGATTSELHLDLATVAAFAVAFLTTAAFWWLYFTSVSQLWQHALETAAHRTELARDAYTYGHVLIIAAIILAAVGDEIAITNTTHDLTNAELTALTAGPTLYLLVQAALRFRIVHTLSPRRLTGAAVCVIVGMAGGGQPALAVSGLLLAVLAAVVTADLLVASRR
jgi:low temperature requirement protein LtrA